jgi:UDP-glucose 4-epimerase
MLNVAIIGANGFIGKHLVEHLSLTPSIKLFLFGRENNTFESSDMICHKIDLMDIDQIKVQFSSIDVVYYLASATIPSSSWENPIIEFEKNLFPFLTFTENIAKLGIKKIVFVSSAGTIYGPSKFKVSENSDKQPFSPYGIVKLTMEHFLNYFKNKYTINFDVYRISNAYGEGQNTSKGLGIINTFIENILSKNEIHIFGNGENIRNYIYVKDVAKVLSHSSLKGLNTSEIYNLSSDDTLSINELVAILQDEITEDFKIIYEENRKSDNAHIDLDNSKLKDEIDNFEFTPIRKGVKETYLYLKNKS